MELNLGRNLQYLLEYAYRKNLQPRASLSKKQRLPVCPKCWPGYKKKLQSDFPQDLSAPALRALERVKVTKLSMLTKHTETEIAGLHGMGPKGMATLKAALKKQKLGFKKA